MTEFSCWCYVTKRQVKIEGDIVGRRQADLLKVTDCEHKICPERSSEFCLIGKPRKGRWP